MNGVKETKMNTDEALKQIGDKDFLDRMYHFSYHRCNSSYEAEDLCAEIILTIIAALKRQEEVVNFHAFTWTIARRVYADFCEKRKKYSVLNMEDLGKNELFLAHEKDEIDNMIDHMAEAEVLKKILIEIAFLSKAYRDVMVMHYIEGIKIRNIAQRLNISETTVRQRLFAARNFVRKGVEAMDSRNLSLKPIHMVFMGDGDPVGNDPCVKAERALSKNLIYLCRKKPRSAKELSEELGVPMPYIEEELEIQCRGENGKYGLLRKSGSEKYITNILLADYKEYVMANEIYGKYIPEICRAIKEGVEQQKDRILSFPFLSPQKDIRFIMWAMIWKIRLDFLDRVTRLLADRFFSDIIPVKREFTRVAVASREETGPEIPFYSIEGINAMDLAGYREVHFVNFFGKWIEPHFRCGHNISQDAGLLMTLKAAGGLVTDDLTEDEKEIAAKAIASGYLRRDGNKIVPKIVAFDKKNAGELSNLGQKLIQNTQGAAEAVARELAEFMKNHIPARLINEYQSYQIIAAASVLPRIVEECLRQGVLSEPEGQSGAEGLLMIVEK